MQRWKSLCIPCIIMVHHNNFLDHPYVIPLSIGNTPNLYMRLCNLRTTPEVGATSISDSICFLSLPRITNNWGRINKICARNPSWGSGASCARSGTETSRREQRSTLVFQPLSEMPTRVMWAGAGWFSSCSCSDRRRSSPAAMPITNTGNLGMPVFQQFWILTHLGNGWRHIKSRVMPQSSA